MGRDATKAVGNPWFEARKNAAIHDGRLSSREGAAELLGMSVSSVADAELGLHKVMPVDKAVLMADLYHSPQLVNYYCLHECPIGKKQALSDEVHTIDRITVKLLRNMQVDKLNTLKDKLLEIAEDGVISDEERPELENILDYLESISRTVSELRILSEIALNGGDYATV